MKQRATTAQEVIDLMLSMQNEKKRSVYMRFFKTGKGQYGEGDQFLGIVNPEVRRLVKHIGCMELSEVHLLLMSPWHEIRLCGLLVLVDMFEKLCTPNRQNDITTIQERDEIIRFYLEHAEKANNWDLVDLSVYKTIGRWLLLPTLLGSNNNHSSMNYDYKIETLDALAASTNLWCQRMSIVATWMTSNKGDASWCIRYSEKHLSHPHDLIHKAVGWMLREMGKHCGMETLQDFLETHHQEMHRTTLRYAIERMSPTERHFWLTR